MEKSMNANGLRPKTRLAVAAVLCLAGEAWLAQASGTAAGAESSSRSHPAMRPLPAASDRPLSTGPKLFVDDARGQDGNAGTAQAPWKTLAHALRRLKPGDTLYLRGGTYHEKVFL